MTVVVVSAYADCHDSLSRNLLVRVEARLQFDRVADGVHRIFAVRNRVEGQQHQLTVRIAQLAVDLLCRAAGDVGEERKSVNHMNDMVRSIGGRWSPALSDVKGPHQGKLSTRLESVSNQPDLPIFELETVKETQNVLNKDVLNRRFFCQAV